MLRDDGTALARYPITAAADEPQRGNAVLAAAIAAKATGGIIAGGGPFSKTDSLVAYKRLADYPVYVTIGRTRSSITGEWLVTIAGYAAILVPAAIGLMLLSLMALRRTRREQAALAQARDALAERAAIEAQLLQAQKMEAVGLLTAGIAHDFNNLLTIVSGNLALLEAERDGLDPRRRKFIAAATSSCEKAAAMVGRLLGFAAREPIDPRPVEVNEVVRRIAELPWRTLGDRIAVELRLANDAWPVLADPSQFENALLNLALNARDAMSAGGSLAIETANLRVDEAGATNLPGIAPGDYVVISVRDTGSGMPPDVLERAFDPFFTTKEAGKGTGLGLAQVSGFVNRCGGHCVIDSTPESGTTVRLYLPRYAGTEPRPPAPAAAEALPGAAAPVGGADNGRPATRN